MRDAIIIFYLQSLSCNTSHLYHYIAEGSLGDFDVKMRGLIKQNKKSDAKTWRIAWRGSHAGSGDPAGVRKIARPPWTQCIARCPVPEAL